MQEALLAEDISPPVKKYDHRGGSFGKFQHPYHHQSLLGAAPDIKDVEAPAKFHEKIVSLREQHRARGECFKCGRNSI